MTIQKTASGLLAGLAVAGSASAALTTGDIAFIGFSADGEDGFSIVALTDIAAGEEIFFRDDEWDGTGFGTGESEFLWTTTALTAGSVVTFITDASDPVSASVGTISDPGAFGDNMGISSGGETIFAFQGTSNTPATFLAAITSANAIEDDISGTGLTVGTTAVVLGGEIDGSQYAGPRNTETAFSDYLALIGDTNNWTAPVDGSGDQSGELLPFDTTSFSVVPEPGSLALLALGGLAVLRRRRG